MAPIPSRKNHERLDKFYATLHVTRELIDISVLFYNIIRAENPSGEWLCKTFMEFYISLDVFDSNQLTGIYLIYDRSSAVSPAAKRNIYGEFFFPKSIGYGNNRKVYPGYEKSSNWNMIVQHFYTEISKAIPDNITDSLKFPSSKRDIVEKMSGFVEQIANSPIDKNSTAELNKVRIVKYWSEIESSIEYV